jgi:hypothetical protein
MASSVTLSFCPVIDIVLRDAKQPMPSVLTTWIITSMSDFFTFRNRAYELLIAPTVSTDSPSLLIGKLTVRQTIMFEPTYPRMAGFWTSRAINLEFISDNSALQSCHAVIPGILIIPHKAQNTDPKPTVQVIYQQGF